MEKTTITAHLTKSKKREMYMLIREVHSFKSDTRQEEEEEEKDVE